jgi:hypothetical protein
MTPRLYVALRERHRQEREYQELLVAINTSTLANHSFNPPKKAYQPYDFMPSRLQREKAKSSIPTDDERSRFAEGLVGLRMGAAHWFKVDEAPKVKADEGENPTDIPIQEPPVVS